MFLSNLLLESDPEPDFWTVRRPLVWEAPVYGSDIRLILSDRYFRITVPEGFRTDLASVPRFLRDRKAFDVNGKSRRPAVLHDWLYATGLGGKGFADRTFHAALLAEGVSRIDAWTTYQAVNWFGGGPYREHARRRAAEAAARAI